MDFSLGVLNAFAISIAVASCPLPADKNALGVTPHHGKSRGIVAL
jgi:hypothetical protein